MKKLLLLLIASFSVIANAQDTDSKEAVLEDVTKDACECVSKKVASGTISQKDIEVELGLCLIGSYSKFKNRVEKYMNVSLEDDASMEEFGREIGMQMITTCPDTFMAFAKDLVEEEVENIKNNKETVEKADINSITAEIVGLKEGQFNIVSFKGTNKRVYKLLWMEYFEGAELLSEMKKLKNKKLKVSYENREMYDSKLEDYRSYKVIRKLEILNE